MAVNASHLVSLVPRVINACEFRRQMTLRTDIAGRAAGVQRTGVGIVAVAAGDAGAVHAALHERTVDIHLVLDLAIREIQMLVQQRQPVRVGKRLPVLVLGGDDPTPRVAAATGLRLLCHSDGCLAALRNTCCRVHVPGGIPVVVEIDGEPKLLVEHSHRRLGLMHGTGSVTGFAADRQLGKRCVVAVRLGIVAHDEISRVTLGTHVVPVLQAPCPVQFVTGLDVFVRVQVVPALTAVGFGSRVPGKGQCLLAAARKLDEVLLQWRHAECEGHGKVPQLTVFVFGANDVLVVASQKTRLFAEIVERRVVEIAEYGRRIGDLHGELMMRAAPLLVLGFMAIRAVLAAQKVGRRVRYRRRRLSRASGNGEGDCQYSQILAFHVSRLPI